MIVLIAGRMVFSVIPSREGMNDRSGIVVGTSRSPGTCLDEAPLRAELKEILIDHHDCWLAQFLDEGGIIGQKHGT